MGTGPLAGLPAETEACSQWVQVPTAQAKQPPEGLESKAAVGKLCSDAAYLLHSQMMSSCAHVCRFHVSCIIHV